MEEQKPEVETSRLEEFSKSSTGAKMGGKVHDTAGFFKRKMGEFVGDEELHQSGRDQQFLGKIYRLVGGYREIQEIAIKRAQTARNDGEKILKKHAGKLIDQASEFLDDIKKTFL